MELQEWFRRYTVRLMEVCSPEHADEFVMSVWTTWGCLDSITALYQFFPNHPEQAADDVFSCELRRGHDADE